MLTQEFSSGVKAGEFAQSQRAEGLVATVQSPEPGKPRVWVVTVRSKSEKAPVTAKSARSYSRPSRNTTSLPVRQTYGHHEIVIGGPVAEIFSPMQRLMMQAQREGFSLWYDARAVRDLYGLTEAAQ